MLPGFRGILKELVDDQKRTADRIKMVDGVPNCRSWGKFLKLLTRAQEVVTDRNVNATYKAKPGNQNPAAAVTPSGEKQCKYEKKKGHCTRGGLECSYVAQQG